MRIAFLTTEYLNQAYGTGGLASYLLRTTRLLHQMGHDIEVFALAPKDDQRNENGIRVTEVSGQNLPLDWIARTRLLWRAKGWLQRFSGYEDALGRAWKLHRAFCRRHRQQPFDIVQAASSMGCGFFTARRKPVPVVTRASSFRPLCREANRIPATPQREQYERVELWQLQRSSAVYAPSRFLVDVLSRNHHINADVIEPPFDTQAIQRVQGELPRDLQPVTYGLYFGGLDYLKGCDRLAAVLPDLLNRHETMRFVFAGRPRHVGDGRQFDAYLRSTLAPFGDRLLVLPELAREELYPLIAQARFVVLPSRVDNLPNACLEAMALRRVVVATRDASFEQLVEEGRTGWLVPQDDEAALTAAMERAWLLDESSRTEMGNCAAGSLQRLRPEQAAVRLIDYFKNMLANQTARGSGALAGTRTAAQQRSPASPEPPDSIASTHHLERQDLTNADRTSSAAGRTFD